MAATKIKHVYGNVMRLAIPLTLRTRMLINSVETESDTDFTDYKGEVIVRLYEKQRERRFVASMSGNVATIEDDGTTPIGTYNVEVLCRNTHDEPMRFMGRFLVQIVDATADAGIDPGIEFDAVTYALEGAIFLYAKGDKGDDGVGIEDIEVEQNASPNGANIVNITLTDGRVYTFQVRNGYGGTSGIIVNGALHTQRADGAIDIGTVIRSHQNLSNYVSESEFNTWIQSYYTKTQADNLLANKASTASVERITPYEVTFTTGNNSNIVCNHTIANIYQNYQSHKPIIGKFGESVGTLVYIKGGENPEAAFLFGDRYDSPYLLRNAGAQYWTKEELGSEIEIDPWPSIESEAAVSSSGVAAALAMKVSTISVNGGTPQEPDEDGNVDLTISGGGTGDVTGVKVGDYTYTPASGSTTVDITSAVVQPETGKGLFSGSYNDLTNKPTIPAAQVQSDWNATSGMGVILNKPTIPIVDATLGTTSQANAVQGGAIVEALAGKEDTLTWDSAPTSSSTNPVTSGGVYTALQGKQNTISDLASIRINSGKGVVDMSSNSDGTVVYTLANGDTYTLDLNHEHPQYVESTDLATVATTGSYDDLVDKPTIPSGVTVDSTITQGGTNAVQGGAIYTALQGKANTSEMSVSTSGDQTTITLKSGTSATVINQHQSLSGRVQSTDVTNIVVCASETAYNNISPKDSNTLYLIKE